MNIYEDPINVRFAIRKILRIYRHKNQTNVTFLWLTFNKKSLNEINSKLLREFIIDNIFLILKFW